MARARSRPTQSAKFAKRRDKPHRWTGLYRDVDGKERSCGTFGSRKQAIAEATKYEHAANEGKRHDPHSTRQTFAAYARTVFESKRSQREGTRKRDQSHLDNHLIPMFGGIQLRHLSTPVVQARINRLTDEKHLAPRTVKEIRRIGWGIMQRAVKANIIPANPFDDVETPPIIAKERAFLDYSQIEALAESMLDGVDRPEWEQHRDRAMIYVGAYLGLRPAELLGLRKAAIDLDKGFARIVGTIEKATGQYVPLTKSAAGRRTVPIPREIVDQVLRPYLDLPKPLSEFAFPSREGGHLDYSNWLRRCWKRAATVAHLDATPHSLRHTGAAIMIDQGADPITIQRRLGHADISTTLRLYGHLLPEKDDLLTDRLSEAFAKARSSTASNVVQLPR